MPRFNNPIPRSGLPRFREGSNLRSPRDSDSTSRQWIKISTASGQVESMAYNLALLQQEVNRLRKRGGVGSGAFAEAYQIVSVEDLYLVCNTWDGTAAGTTAVNVAKDDKLAIIEGDTEDIFGTTYEYTYSAGPDANNKYRTKTDTGTSDTEQQLVVPPWLVGDIIYAVTVLDTGVPDAKTKLAISPSRQWAKV